MNNIDLTPLKDIHIMSEPSWWPLAYGWWLILFIIAVICIVYCCLHHWWNNRPIIYAQKELKRIEGLSKDLDFLHASSDLMKRVAILVFGREKIAPLTEDKWQSFLLKSAPKIFTSHQAKLIAFSPYLTKLNTHIDRPVFSKLIRKWIQEILKK